MTASPVRTKCSRLARRIIFRCGSVQFLRLVSVRMLAYSNERGQMPVLGLGVPQLPIVQPSFNSARPRRVSFCLRVSQSRSDGTR